MHRLTARQRAVTKARVHGDLGGEIVVPEANRGSAVLLMMTHRFWCWPRNRTGDREAVAEVHPPRAGVKAT
jgi:hypothetical protein